MAVASSRKQYLSLSSESLIAENHATAQDILQEAFIAAYKAFDGYTEQGKVLPWLKTIARNTAYRHMYKESRLVCVSLSEDERIF